VKKKGIRKRPGKKREDRAVRHIVRGDKSETRSIRSRWKKKRYASNRSWKKGGHCERTPRAKENRNFGPVRGMRKSSRREGGGKKRGKRNEWARQNRSDRIGCAREAADGRKARKGR